MAKTRTLSELRQDFLDRGGWRNSTKFGNSVVDRWLNEAIGEVWDLLVQTWVDYFLKEDTSLTTSAGTSQTFLPTDFYKLRRIDYRASASDKWKKVRPAGLDVIYGLQNASRGRMRAYHLRGMPGGSNDYDPALVWGPVPDATYTLRVLYIPVAPTLSDDADVFDGINGYETCVVAKAVLKGERRQGKETSAREREVMKEEARIKSSAPSRDASEPVRLADHVEDAGPIGFDDEEYGW